MFAILYTIFGKVLKLGAGVPNYALSLLLGIVLWNFFAEATSGALKSVVAKGSLIRKINIPRHLIPISSTASAFINMLLNLAVVFFFVLVLGPFNEVSWTTLFVLPLLIIELIVFTIGIGFLLSAVYVKLRDVDYIWEVARQALFYSIPIIYPLSRVPTEWVQQVMMMNPLVQIIQDSRSVITYSGTERVPDVFPSTLYYLIPITIVVVFTLIGVFYFRKKSKHFAEYI